MYLIEIFSFFIIFSSLRSPHSLSPRFFVHDSRVSQSPKFLLTDERTHYNERIPYHERQPYVDQQSNVERQSNIERQSYNEGQFYRFDRVSQSPKTSKLSASLPTGWASNLSASYTGYFKKKKILKKILKLD